MRAKNMALSGWGRGRFDSCQAVRPERFSDVLGAFSDPILAGDRGFIAHGAGRSYGDCALNGGGAALITTRLDRILDFDAETGVVSVEPGVNFNRLLAVFLARGWLVPVTPGTGFTTIGGAVANDVHGKNHEAMGCFGQHVVGFDLLTPDGMLRRVTPENDPALFRATVGGLGLTGILTRISFRMQAVPGPSVRVRERRLADLDGFLAAMQDAAGATYSVGWIDGTATGSKLGRGILEVAEPSDAPLPAPLLGRLSVPMDFPALALNPLSIAAFNEFYFRRVPQWGRVSEKHFSAFLYPLDAIGGWNRIYGKRGFFQFQCVVPFSSGAAALRELLELIAASRKASFLAVLKRMGPGRAGYLSFPMAGWTLALDFPAGEGVAALYAKLVAVTAAHGGRVYLAKDALLTAGDLPGMYPELPEFQDVVDRVDPERRLRSDMSRRLGLHRGAA